MTKIYIVRHAEPKETFTDEYTVIMIRTTDMGLRQISALKKI